MEARIKYQYTYFIQPFIISEKKYDKYIINLLKDKRFNLKIFNAEKNIEIEKYFNNEIKEIMFNTLSKDKKQIKELENIKEKEYSKVLKMPCICFEYIINQGTQAKLGEESGIFFKLDKIEIICFRPGICFISMKTFLDENIKFKDILNFNNKFKELNTKNIEANEKINIQSSEYKDKTELIAFINELTGNNIEKNEFYTYSYVCIDGEEWNEKKEFSEIQKNFIKLVEEVPESQNKDEKISIIDEAEYIKIGINKKSTALITNSLDTYNYTKLPFEYENEYRYTLIYALYQKMMLKEFGKQIKNISKKLSNFINTSWAKEITKNKLGSKLYKIWREKLELENTYLEIVDRYEMEYKKQRINKHKKNNKIIWGIIGICVILNIINIIILINLK